VLRRIECGLEADRTMYIQQLLTIWVTFLESQCLQQHGLWK